MAELPRPTTKQELYDRIRSSSKDEVILEEMIRLGFWSLQESSEPGSNPADERARMAELERRLQQLAMDGSRMQNLELVKKQLHEQRLKAAREKREETKRRREEERRSRARAWKQRKTTEIVYLGEGVSTSLGKREGKVREGLPELHDAAALAQAMGISVGLLRFLAFHKRVSSVSHWRRFQVPKKTGGLRVISAPMPKLKAAQRWILTHILEKLPVHEAAHGFVAGRSIVTNARQHVGQEVVINLDMKDFFPTLTWLRVRGLFSSLGYSPEAATILSLLCTEAETDEVEVDGRRWFVHSSERRLPQGSPCSPAITNLVCVRLDQRLTGLARKLGFTYTRYADDLTFSGSAETKDKIQTLLGAVRGIVADEGFELHPDKTRVMRKGGCQEVTGLVVNRKLGVSRHLVRRWRAVMFQVERDGPEGKKLGPSSDVLASLTGFASFVQMVEPEKGASMLQRARALSGRAPAEGSPPPAPSASEPSAPEQAPAEQASAEQAPSSDGEGAPGEKKGKWWEFWKKGS